MPTVKVLPPVIITKDNNGKIINSVSMDTLKSGEVEMFHNDLDEMSSKAHFGMNKEDAIDVAMNVDSFDKYMINKEFNRVIQPYPCGIINNCRFPKESANAAVFINYTQQYQKVFGPEDGVQYLSDKVKPGDVYYIVPPTENWLMDKNLNFFCRLIPPNDIRSLKLSIKYDNTWHKNVIEEKSDVVLVPSIDMLDGMRISIYRPTTALAYFQPPYIEKPTPDSVYQTNNPLEGFFNMSSEQSILNILFMVLMIFIVLVSSCFGIEYVNKKYNLSESNNNN